MYMENFELELIDHLELDPDFADFTTNELEELVKYIDTIQ